MPIVGDQALSARLLPEHLKRLEAESIGIMREVAAEFRNPVLLYSIGKDSSVMLHLARKAFFPSKPPFPLLHIDTGWKFRDMIAFRDDTVRRLGLDLVVHTNEEGRARGINPITSGSALHTAVMKTDALKQALDRHGFDAALGGARRDEEKSRAKERVFSVRSAGHAWDPKNQRPELWRLYNTRLRERQSMRVFPLSNWTELDIWEYVASEEIPVVPALLREAAPGNQPRWSLDHGRRRSSAAGARRAARIAVRPLSHFGVLSADRRHRVDRCLTGSNRRRTAQYAPFRAPGPADRQ